MARRETRPSQRPRPGAARPGRPPRTWRGDPRTAGSLRDTGWRESRNAPALPPVICRTGSCIVPSRRIGFSPCGLLSSAASHVIASEARQSPDFRRCPFNSLQPRCHGTSLLRHHDSSLTLHGPAREPRTRAVQGRRRYARTRRRSGIPSTSRALATFSGGGSWAEPLWKTAHRRIPTEGVST